MLEPGTQIGRYVIQRRLGHGVLGTTYLAHDPSLGRQVAITIASGTLATPDARERLRTEGRAAGNLQHRHIVTIFDIDEHESELYVVTEYVKGETLAGLIRRSAPEAFLEKLRWMEELCDGVAYAHRMHVVHPGLNPANLMIDRSGTLKIMDFGMGALRSPGPDDSIDVETLRYIAPEGIAGQRLDARSDQFAIGAVFYELLTYTTAFPGGTPAEILRRIQHEEPAPLEQVAPHVPPEIVAIVERALRKRPDERFPDVKSMRLAIVAVRRKLSPEQDVMVPTPPAASRPKDVAHGRPQVEPLPGLIELILQKANTSLEKGEFEAVIQACKQVLTIEPHNRRAIELERQLERARLELESRKAQQRPIATAPANALDENVQFTVFRPKTIAPATWHTMLVFAHLSEPRPDAPPGEPHPVKEMERQAEAVLGDLDPYRNITVDSGEPIPRDGELTIVPHAAGITFNPASRSFRWTESVHREEFRLRTETAPATGVARGRVSVFLGSVIIAEVALTFRVGADTSPARETVRDVARRYRKIFASYSHRDRAVVDEFTEYARAMGDRYLRDVVDLRAGETWRPALENMIRQADVFQLFWSWNAMASPAVRHEWEFALALQRPAFIRPVYWDEPLPMQSGLPPAALSELHFQRIRPRLTARPVAPGAPAAQPVEPDTNPVTPPSLADPDRTMVVRIEDEELPPTSSAPPSPKRGVSWRVIGSIAAGLVLVVAMTGLLVDQTGVETQPPLTSPSPRPGDIPPGASRLSIRVTAPAPEIASSATVDLLNADTGETIATTVADAAGDAMFGEVASGRYQLVVTVPGLSRVVRDLRVDGDQTILIDVTGN